MGHAKLAQNFRLTSSWWADGGPLPEAMQNVEELFSRNAAHFWSVPSGFILQQIQQYCGVLSR